MDSTLRLADINTGLAQGEPERYFAHRFKEGGVASRNESLISTRNH